MPTSCSPPMKGPSPSLRNPPSAPSRKALNSDRALFCNPAKSFRAKTGNRSARSLANSSERKSGSRHARAIQKERCLFEENSSTQQDLTLTATEYKEKKSLTYPQASQAPSQILSLSALPLPSAFRSSCIAARKLALSGKTSLPMLRTGTRRYVIPRAVRSGRGRTKGCSRMEKGVLVR